MKSTIRSTVGVLVATALLVGLVATSAGAAESMRGWGVVMARDTRASTLQIDDGFYKVTSSTVFRALDGALLTFPTLPIFDVHKGLFDLADATKVEFVAERGRDGAWVLDSVQIIDKLPD